MKEKPDIALAWLRKEAGVNSALAEKIAADLGEGFVIKEESFIENGGRYHNPKTGREYFYAVTRCGNNLFTISVCCDWFVNPESGLKAAKGSIKRKVREDLMEKYDFDLSNVSPFRHNFRRFHRKGCLPQDDFLKQYMTSLPDREQTNQLACAMVPDFQKRQTHLRKYHFVPASGCS